MYHRNISVVKDLLRISVLKIIIIIITTQITCPKSKPVSVFADLDFVPQLCLDVYVILGGQSSGI